MKIIKVTICKDCPYKSISYSFANALWTLRCMKDTQKVQEHKFISDSKYIKDKLKYDIPEWCTLQNEDLP